MDNYHLEGKTSPLYHILESFLYIFDLCNYNLVTFALNF